MALAVLQLGVSESQPAIFAGPSDASAKPETEKSGFAALLHGLFGTSLHATTKNEDSSSNGAGAGNPRLSPTPASANLAIAAPLQILPAVDVADATMSDQGSHTPLAELEGQQTPAPQGNALQRAAMTADGVPATATDAAFSKVVAPEAWSCPRFLDQPSNEAPPSIAAATSALSSMSATTNRSQSVPSLEPPASAQSSGKNNDGLAQSPGQPARKNHLSGNDWTSAIPSDAQFLAPGFPSAPPVAAAGANPGAPIPHIPAEPLLHLRLSAFPVASPDPNGTQRDVSRADDFTMPASAKGKAIAPSVGSDKSLATGPDSPAGLPRAPVLEPSRNPDAQPLLALLRMPMPAGIRAGVASVSASSAHPTELPPCKPAEEESQVQQKVPLPGGPVKFSMLHLSPQESVRPRVVSMWSSSPNAKAESNSISALPWAPGEDGGSNARARGDVLYQLQDKPLPHASQGGSHRDHDSKAGVSASDPVPPESSAPSSFPMPAEPYVHGESAAGISGTLSPAPLITSAAHATSATPADTSLASKLGTSSSPLEPPLPQSSDGGVHSARLVDGLQSEMHIGLHSSTFGSIEVHTVVRESQVGLTVGSEKGDLRSILGAEMPALQNSLGQHQLRFDDVRFLTQPSHSSSAFSGFGDSHTRRDQPDRNAPQTRFFAPGSAASEEPARISASTTGLNIHA